MKELEKHEPLNPNELKVEQQVIKQLVHLGRFQHRPTHKIWELDFATGEVKEAKMDTVVNFDSTKTSKVVARENCIYNQALNYKNAVRKFRNTLISYKKHAGI